MRQLTVSAATYNELMEELAKHGVPRLAEAGALTINKDDSIKQPHDFRSVTLRRDVSDIAAKVYKGDDNHFIHFVVNLHNYILSGIVPTTDNNSKAGWGSGTKI